MFFESSPIQFDNTREHSHGNTMNLLTKIIDVKIFFVVYLYSQICLLGAIW